MKTLTTITSDNKRDLVKASVTTNTFKDFIDTPLTMTGVIMYEKDEADEKTGEVKTVEVSCVKTDEQGFISSISPTVKNSLETIANAFSEEEILAGVPIVIKSKKSNGGRDFYYVDLQ